MAVVDTKRGYVGRYEERLVQQESGASLSKSRFIPTFKYTLLALHNVITHSIITYYARVKHLSSAFHYVFESVNFFFVCLIIGAVVP